MSRGGAGRHSFAESLLVSVAILALLAALVGGGRGELVTPHADARFDISLVVPAQERFLVLRVRPVAFPAARRAALRPASEATDADAVLLAKRSHHTTRILAAPAHRSGPAGRVYHPHFAGSFSLKDVLPALVPELTYEGMAVANGQDAGIAWQSLVKETLDQTERDRIRKALLEYCGKDTLALVRLLETLRLH